MRRVGEWPLWIGDRGDVRDLAKVRSAGIRALVDLAMDEPPLNPGREMVYCRFPLLDGAGNDASTLRAAVGAVASLARAAAPTLVFCSGGMSRSPAVAAAALSVSSRRPPGELLAEIMRAGPADVTGGLWREALAAAEWIRRVEAIWSGGAVSDGA